jgi:hypothetical protein
LTVTECPEEIARKPLRPSFGVALAHHLLTVANPHTPPVTVLHALVSL